MFSLNNKLPQHFPLVLFGIRTCQIDKEVSNKVQSQNWPSKDPKVIGCLCYRSKSSLDLPLNKESAVISCFFLLRYRISSNCFRRNYSFLKVENVEIFIYIVSALCNFLLHKWNSCQGNYGTGETIQVKKLFAAIRYSQKIFKILVKWSISAQQKLD